MRCMFAMIRFKVCVVLAYKWLTEIDAGGGCSYKLTGIEGYIDIYIWLADEWMKWGGEVTEGDLFGRRER